MGNVRHLFLVLSALLLAGAAPNKVDIEQKSYPTDLAEEFLDAVAAGKVAEAVDKAFSPEILRLLGPSIQPTTAQIAAYVPGLLGAAQGYELYREEHLSSRIHRLVYFLNLEKMPTVWEFYYYERDGQWELVNFSFNTQFEGLETHILD